MVLLATILLALSTAGAQAAACTNPIVRSEWSQLTTTQKKLYIQAVQALIARPQTGPSETLDPKLISYYDFVNIHARASPWAHGSAEFYPYHRAQVWVWEQALHSTGIWPANMGAPYWDWTAVSQNWWTKEASDIFTPSYFGSVLSTDTTNWCVQDSAFSQFHVATLDDDNVAYSNGIHATGNCLRRCGEIGSTVVSPADINPRFGATSFSAFRGDTAAGTDDQQLSGFHSEGHEIMGGYNNCLSDMGNPSISPNDPYFWLHHGLVDKIWWRWQTRCKNFRVDYSGPLTARDPIDPAQTLTAVSNQMLDSWGVTVSQMLDTQGQTLCYVYSNSAGDIPMPPITCPNFNGAPDPGLNPDPTVFGSPQFGVASSSGNASGSSSGSVLDQLVKNMVGVGLDTVKGGTVVFGKRDIVIARNVTVEESVSVSSSSPVPSARASTSPSVSAGVAASTTLSTKVNASSSSSSSVGNGGSATESISATATITESIITSDNSSEPTPTPTPHFEMTVNDDNTIDVTFTKVNQTITVPENQTLHWVYESYVETREPDGEVARHYLEVEEIPYVRIPGAPANVPAGHPCYRKHPPPMSDHWIHHHKLNEVKIRNTEARRNERIDQWNVENSTVGTGVYAAACNSPIVRSEWNQLTTAQKKLYMQAIQTLISRPQTGPTETLDPKLISYYDFVNIHARASPYAHGSAEFYPYHRAQVWIWEQALHSTGIWPPNMGAPYWDWTTVSQNWWTPEASDIFTPSYFGSVLSTDTTEWCVQDSAFSFTQFHVAALDTDVLDFTDGMHATSNCLRRCGDVGSTVVSPSDINRKFGATSYSAFRGDTATGTDDQEAVAVHSQGHVVIGGHNICLSDLGNGSISPNDPIFWLHHGLVDKMWWRWQTRCKQFKVDYSGPLTAGDPIDPTHTLTAVSNQMLDRWGVTVSQMLDTQGDTLCYVYSNSVGDIPMPPITCPIFNGTPDPGLNPDPTLFGSPQFGIPSSTNSGNGNLTNESLSGNALDQLVKRMVGVGLEVVKAGSIVFGKRDSVFAASETMEETLVSFLPSTVSPTTNVGCTSAVNSASTSDFTPSNPGTSADTAPSGSFSDGASTKASTRTGSSSASLGFGATVKESTTTTVTESIITSDNSSEPTPTPTPHFEMTVNDDNTIDVTFTKVNQTITVPENQTLHWVYESYVETREPDGEIARHYLEVEEIPYVRIPGAPVDVPAGHPCYRKHPPPMNKHWIRHHMLNEVKIRNTEARMNERIDKWNMENCGTDPASK
ncbi:UNVERIFIED_CONTAM: hypothetical protein HDU68_001756 [Siphonaria sp. JEL0065]|nr:hypothetical protein HDU68_001756 [Siphonaria sp. JEL0065]